MRFDGIFASQYHPVRLLCQRRIFFSILGSGTRIEQKKIKKKGIFLSF